MTAPIDIEVALWYFTRAGDFPHHSESHTGVIDRFLAAGLLRNSPRVNQNWEASEGLEVYVRALLEVPLPEKVVRWEFPPF